MAGSSEIKAAPERQTELDIVKFIAILPMPIAHCLAESGYDSTHGVWYFLNVMLGATVFMVCMGYGFAFSRRTSKEYLIRRGIKTLLMGYALNIVRCLMPVILSLVLQDDTYLAEDLGGFADGDILQFAGLAMIVTGFLQDTGNPPLYAVIIGVVLSVAHTFIPTLTFSDTLPAALCGLFVYSENSLVSMDFPFFAWYIFVAAGYLLGSKLKKAENLTSFYLKAGIPCAVLALGYWIFSCIQGSGPMNPDIEGLSMMNFQDALASVGWIICYIGLTRFLTRLIPQKIQAFAVRASSAVNEIYIAHWIILFWVVLPVFRLLETLPSMPLAAGCGLLVLALSVFAGLFYCRLKAKRAAKRVGG